jgi:flagellar biosynthetic protein FliQ
MTLDGDITGCNFSPHRSHASLTMSLAEKVAMSTIRRTVQERVMGDLGADAAMTLTSEMLWTAVILAAPVIGVATLVGLAVSILQVVTQIQESSLSFVPKLVAAVAVLLVMGGWMMATLMRYASGVINSIPQLL